MYKLNLQGLQIEYDKLQIKYGAKELDSIYNGGLSNNPDIWYIYTEYIIFTDNNLSNEYDRLISLL